MKNDRSIGFFGRSEPERDAVHGEESEVAEEAVGLGGEIFNEIDDGGNARVADGVSDIASVEEEGIIGEHGTDGENRLINVDQNDVESVRHNKFLLKREETERVRSESDKRSDEVMKRKQPGCDAKSLR